jgi:antitoxin PrlF
MPTATMSSKGQAVIPKEIRAFMGLHPGDMLDFLIQDDQTVVIKPAHQHITQLRGLLYKPDRKAVSLDEMKVFNGGR